VSLRVFAAVLLAVLVGTTLSSCAAGPRDGFLTLSGSDATEPPTCSVAAPVRVESLDGTDVQSCLPSGQERPSDRG
jgi:hypothetical protein